MRNVARIQNAGMQETYNVFRPKAVSYSPDLPTSHLGSHIVYDGLHDRVNPVGEVSRRTLEPFHDIEPIGPVELHRVSVEQVRHDH
jgi:hypothetical protein